jgi:hypothetical protein
MSFALPVERLREIETLLAFYHPKPAYPFHHLHFHLLSDSLITDN